jgi:predicted nucleotidyltransferase
MRSLKCLEIDMNLASTEKEKIVEICERNDIEFCAVFGSFARGEAHEKSDIDLLVRFSKPKAYNWLDAAFEIEDVLGKKVDLVTENGLSPHIREYVLKDLQVLYDKGK